MAEATPLSAQKRRALCQLVDGLNRVEREFSELKKAAARVTELEKRPAAPEAGAQPVTTVAAPPAQEPRVSATLRGPAPTVAAQPPRVAPPPISPPSPAEPAPPSVPPPARRHRRSLHSPLRRSRPLPRHRTSNRRFRVPRHQVVPWRLRRRLRPFPRRTPRCTCSGRVPNSKRSSARTG